MSRMIAGTVILMVWALASPAHPQPSGQASVTDGDTLEIAGERVRLHGIDAPEREQPCHADGRPWQCGQAATQALQRRIGGQAVTCTPRDRDRYGRVVAVCETAGGSLNAWLVAQGWALAYRRYSTAYVDEERAAKRGVWRGQLVPPWEWRRGKRLAAPARASVKANGGCRIKGNIGRNGKRIYHMPGDRYYERTVINSATGERWFCSEDEAQAAGWRRTKR